MPTSDPSNTGPGNTAVPQPAQGDHDRVAMLSLRADGVPDQTAPEIIGDKDGALEATREQFRQQAVSAVDQQERGVVADTGTAEQVEQDPEIAALKDKHQQAEKSAEGAAESAVGELFTDDEKLQTGTADTKPAESERPVADTPAAQSQQSKSRNAK